MCYEIDWTAHRIYKHRTFGHSLFETIAQRNRFGMIKRKKKRNKTHHVKLATTSSKEHSNAHNQLEIENIYTYICILYIIWISRFGKTAHNTKQLHILIFFSFGLGDSRCDNILWIYVCKMTHIHTQIQTQIKYIQLMADICALFW